ncbi:MAG: VOC family protein [Armatimonadetes bacterium]|nr:VOC family protein [Armatimonadota bacterium]
MALTFDHVNISVVSIDRTVVFLRVAFPELVVRGGDKGQWDDMKTAWIHLGTDDSYVSINETSAMEPHARDGSRTTGINHVGFIVGNVEALRDAYEAAGLKVAYMNELPARRRPYVTDEDEIMWEFVEYPSDDPAVRNDYSI